MFLRNLLLAICLLITFNPRGQNNSTASNYLPVYRAAENFYNTDNPCDSTDRLALLNYTRVIAILKNNDSNDSVLFDCYVKSGILSMSANQNNQAINYFLQSITLGNKSKNIPDSILFESYLYAGNSYHNILNMDSALYYYGKAEFLINKYPSINEAERLYNQSGVLYYETGDYKKSIAYFNKALSITESRLPVNEDFVVNYKNNIASAYRKTRNYEEALELYKSLLSYNVNKNELFQNIGATLIDEGNYHDAIFYLKKVAYRNASKFNDLGRAYMLLHDDDSASYYFNKALEFHDQLHSRQKNIDYAYTLKYLGDIDVERGMSRNAIEKYQQAIIQADPDFNDSDVMHNPSSFYGLHQSFLLFDALTAKAAAFQMASSGLQDDAFLAKSFETYSSALTLSRHVERMYNSDEARFFLKKSVDSIYKKIVDVGLDLYEKNKDMSYIFKVLKYIEDDKASVLQADLHELELSMIKTLPQDLLRQEKKIKSVLSSLNNTLSQTIDIASANKLRLQIQDAEIQLSSVLGKLNDNPAYYKLKFNPPAVDVKSLRLQAHRDEVILSFYYTGKRLVCFFMTKDSFGYKASPLQADMLIKISTLRNELYAQGKGNRQVVAALSGSLYNILIKPVETILRNKKHLVIIPYNEIGYIPFEILVNPVNNELLLNRFAISYNYSVNFLQNYKTEYSDYKVLALAPFNKSVPGENYPALKASANEVENLPGKILLGENATKNNFLELCSKFPIVHLATHAIVDNANSLKSFIAFYPSAKGSSFKSNLYEGEIYNLDFTGNQLVILSACETGNGQMINGEGIISLSRAFFYSGCRSVATTLWKAEDISIAFITKRMHDYLQKGYAKDEALQKAKLDYLKSDEIDARFKIPGYWAPLVLSGDFNAVTNPAGYQRWFFAFLAVIILFFAFFLYKRTRFFTRK